MSKNFGESTTASATYAVTANINVKVLDFRVRWELPGLSYCDYSMSVLFGRHSGEGRNPGFTLKILI